MLTTHGWQQTSSVYMWAWSNVSSVRSGINHVLCTDVAQDGVADPSSPIRFSSVVTYSGSSSCSPPTTPRHARQGRSRAREGCVEEDVHAFPALEPCDQPMTGASAGTPSADTQVRPAAGAGAVQVHAWVHNVGPARGAVAPAHPRPLATAPGSRPRGASRSPGPAGR